MHTASSPLIRLVLSAYRMYSKWLFGGKENKQSATLETCGPVWRVGAHRKATPWGFVTCQTIAVDIEDRVAR